MKHKAGRLGGETTRAPCGRLVAWQRASNRWRNVTCQRCWTIVHGRGERARGRPGIVDPAVMLRRGETP